MSANQVCLHSCRVFVDQRLDNIERDFSRAAVHWTLRVDAVVAFLDLLLDVVHPALVANRVATPEVLAVVLLDGHVVYLAHHVAILLQSHFTRIFVHHLQDEILQLDTGVIHQEIVFPKRVQNQALVQLEVFKPFSDVHNFTAQQRVQPLLVDHYEGVLIPDLHTGHPHEPRHCQFLVAVLAASHQALRGLLVLVFRARAIATLIIVVRKAFAALA